MVLTFQSIGLQGSSLGTITFKDDIIEWKDRSNNQQTLNKAHISSMKWATYGNKASVHIIDADGKSIKFDGTIF